MIRGCGARGLYFGGSSPLAIALRTVFRSMPSWRAMAETDKPLSMKIQNHHEFPEFDHRAAPSRQREQHRCNSRRPTSQGMPWKVGRHENWGNFTP